MMRIEQFFANDKMIIKNYIKKMNYFQNMKIIPKKI